jgi:thiol-disulfide isomerase/thioredoxin
MKIYKYLLVLLVVAMCLFVDIGTWVYAESNQIDTVVSNEDNATEAGDNNDEEKIEEEKEPVELYLFYSNSCPHCSEEEEFLADYIENNPNKVNVNYLEVSTDPDNGKIMSKVGAKLSKDVRGVPFTVIGKETISGFGSANTTGVKISEAIDKCYEEGCEDVVKPIKEEVEADTGEENNSLRNVLLLVGGIIGIGVLLVVFLGFVE